MSEQLKENVRCYAAERLTEARADIAKYSSKLLVCRAKVEKYRESDPNKAHKHYTELEAVRTQLVHTLSDTRLALSELDEAGLSKAAGKLSAGLNGFNLMSRKYKPVYEALMKFAGMLPETPDSVNAKTIARLMNNVRMGYYPTDPENISHILEGIQFPEGVTTNVFDPCCGCGKALRQMAEGNNCYTYGVELDVHRAEEAQTRLHRVGVGSYFYSRISSEAFHLMLLNPPYLSVMTEGGSKARHEKRFLAESIGHLMMGGLLIYIVPYYRLTSDVCRILADNFDDLSVWRFTGEEFSKFKQIAVLGIRKKRRDYSDGADTLERLACEVDALPCITQLEENRYPLPAAPKAVETFKGEKFNEKELERQLSHSDSLRRLMNAKSELDSTDKHPLLPLSIGQIGLVGGSGMINGLIDCDTPHVIKGRIIKVRNEEETEKYNKRGDFIGTEIKEVISNKMIFNVLTPDGFRSLT